MEYCDKISSYLTEKNVDREAFLGDSYHQDICSFYCLQIGETANDLSAMYVEAHPEVEWRKIVGLRNNIAHEYGNIDADILWKVVTKNIPELEEFCKGQIKNR